MGRAKAWLMEQYERGYMAADGDICTDCVSDEALVQWVADNVEATECSFCGRVGDDPIAASFDDFVGVVRTGIGFDWNHPDSEGIMYISAEGGYQASITDTWDVLSEYDISERDEVIQAIIDSIGNDGWVEREYYVGDESQRLSWGWNAFKEVVKHRTRYVFLTPSDEDHTEVPPSRMLAEIGSTITENLSELELIKSVSPDTDLIRVRIGAARYSSSGEMGTPPVQFANQPNRMSPAGIPMFYGAFDEDTARAETFDATEHAGQTMSVGTFRATRSLKMLDLVDLPPIPSVFEDRHQLIHPLRFLHAFSSDIAKPIVRDGREHIEYVPTQIVTEYFRHVFRDAEGQPVDGIIYASSRHAEGCAFVLFFDNEQCGGESPWGPPTEPTLCLMAVKHEECSAAV
jgi:hypothetical protein